MLEKKKPWVVSLKKQPKQKNNIVYVCVRQRARKHQTFPLCYLHLLQGYETIRKELEGVKKMREEAKQQLATLKQAQAPMLKKIQEIEMQLKPTETRIKAMVGFLLRQILLTGFGFVDCKCSDCSLWTGRPQHS